MTKRTGQNYCFPVTKLIAPAKINLRLKITGCRPDGYHLLDMIMVKLDLADQVKFELTKEGIYLESDSDKVPCDRSNTLWKVVELVRQESRKKFGAKIFFRKRIPTAAGLGGGSSDAASLLLALRDQLGLDWSDEKLIQIGVRVGADVPFFLVQGAQKVQGIGEILTPLALSELQQVEGLPLILINPGFPVSTKEAFGWWDQGPHPASGHPLPLTGEGLGVRVGLTGAGLDAIPAQLENDLERVVIPRYPVLSEIKELLIRVGAHGTLMSGSGATVFGLFESTALRDRGFEQIERLKKKNWWTWKGNSLGGEESNLD